MEFQQNPSALAANASAACTAVHAMNQLWSSRMTATVKRRLRNPPEQQRRTQSGLRTGPAPPRF